MARPKPSPRTQTMMPNKQQIVPADPVQEGHLREVRKLQVRFTAGTMLLRISWECECYGREGGAQTNCDTPKYIFHFEILSDSSRRWRDVVTKARIIADLRRDCPISRLLLCATSASSVSLWLFF